MASSSASPSASVTPPAPEASIIPASPNTPASTSTPQSAISPRPAVAPATAGGTAPITATNILTAAARRPLKRVRCNPCASLIVTAYTRIPVSTKNPAGGLLCNECERFPNDGKRSDSTILATCPRGTTSHLHKHLRVFHPDIFRALTTRTDSTPGNIHAYATGVHTAFDPQEFWSRIGRAIIATTTLSTSSTTSARRMPSPPATTVHLSLLALTS